MPGRVEFDRRVAADTMRRLGEEAARRAEEEARRLALEVDHGDNGNFSDDVAWSTHHDVYQPPAYDPYADSYDDFSSPSWDAVDY